MAHAIRSVACAIGFAASMIAAGLAAGGKDQGYFVIVLGLVWSIVFGLLLLRMTAGSASFPHIMQYLFDPHQAPEESSD